ncbi:hypothetical protein ABZS61_29225 [Streptomyces sp. NPDC005566]|uniref:hypothetical protein n=1 Tax=Streptomyces sp. NPDC005566 TaxID=3156886 RepID=UPI0033A84161
MRLSDAVGLAGGEARPELLAEVLTRAGSLAVQRSLDVLRFDAEATSPDGRPASVVVVNSNSMVCRARRLDGGDSVVVIPLGILARARALARRLLHLLSRSSVTDVVIGNVIDRRPDWELAPGLVPLFGEQTDQDGEQCWSALKAFDAESPEDETRDSIADDIMELSLHYLVGHELAHLYGRHDRLLALALALAQAGDRLVPPDLSLSDLRRGLEVHADLMAAMTVAHRLLPFVMHSDERGTLIARQFFAVAMLFGMYDTHRKSLTAYEHGRYPHPVIRFELTHCVTLDVVGKVAPEFLETARKNALAGWAESDRGMSAMEIDCVRGHFGWPSQGDTTRFVPVTTLKYGSTSRVLPAYMDLEYRLGRQVASMLEELE